MHASVATHALPLQALVATQAMFTSLFSVDIGLNITAFGLQPFWSDIHTCNQPVLSHSINQ